MTQTHDFRQVGWRGDRPRVAPMENRSDVVASVVLAGVVMLVGAPVAILQASGGDPTAGPWWLWWVCYAAYIACTVATVWVTESGHRGRGTWLGIAAMTATGIAVYLLGSPGWTAILLVLTAAIAAHYLPWGPVLAVVAVQTLVIPLPSLPGAPPWELILGAAIYGGLQMLSVAAVWIQLRETAMRRELAVANTELRATTALLAETSRTAERLRISRELHDVVGHQLTALVLELEVAGHHAAPPAREHVARARSLAKDLLGDVRSTVGGLREQQPPLRAALELLVADLPRPHVHLAIDEELLLEEEQAATFIRCVQEIVTNAIRHSGAEHLWIEIARDDAGGATLHAFDDGRGAARFVPGHGLSGMTERFEQVGGGVAFDPAGGFTVDARVPAR